MTDHALVEQAFAMLERAYVPYSHFPVGAALEGEDGKVYTGSVSYTHLRAHET